MSGKLHDVAEALMRSLYVLLPITLAACGARSLDESIGAAGAGGAVDAGSDPSAIAPGSATKRTLAEFRAQMVGVWEGNVASPAAGVVKPAERVRIEFNTDGQYIGKCLQADETDPHPEQCMSLPSIPDGPSPRRLWRLDRLTAGYEGMGEVTFTREASSATRIVLHRVRVSPDGLRMTFTALWTEDGAITYQYTLTRVSR